MSKQQQQQQQPKPCSEPWPPTPPPPQLRVWKEDGKDRYRYQTEHLCIFVRRYVDYAPDAWFVSCLNVNLLEARLAKTDLEEAKEAAIETVFAWLRGAARELHPE